MPAMSIVERLIAVPAADRDKIWRNDFVSSIFDPLRIKLNDVHSAGKNLTGFTLTQLIALYRHLNAVTSSWRGLDTLISLTGGDSLGEAVAKEYDVLELQQHPFLPLASLCLTDPKDPRYQTVTRYREHLGKILHSAAVSLRAEKTEDHTDAVSSKVTPVMYVTCTNQSHQP